MDNYTLKAEPRLPNGSRASRRLRNEGQVPAVVYGRGDTTPFSLDWRELRQVLAAAGSNALVTLEIDGESTLALVKDLQRHPVRQTVSHVDFKRVDASEKVTVEVPLVLEGESEEVIHAGATVEQILFYIEVTCPVTDIPHELTADVSKITMAEALTGADIALPDGVEMHLEEDATIAVATITSAALAEEEEVEGEELEGVEGEEVEASDSDSAGEETSEDAAEDD